MFRGLFQALFKVLCPQCWPNQLDEWMSWPGIRGGSGPGLATNRW